MFRIDQETSDRAEKLAQLNRWTTLAKADPFAALEERLLRSALSAVAIDDPANQDEIMAHMRPRSVEPARFAAFQTILCDTTLSEDLRRFQIVALMRSRPKQTD